MSELWLLRRTVSGIADFRGRSRRWEVVQWWLATTFLGVFIAFPLSFLMPYDAFEILMNLLGAAVLLPMFALFVRRLHDQDRSGWWGLILPLGLILGWVKQTRWREAPPEAVLAGEVPLHGPLTIATGLLAVGLLVLLLLPGTEGPNRYGEDPRL